MKSQYLQRSLNRSVEKNASPLIDKYVPDIAKPLLQNIKLVHRPTYFHSLEVALITDQVLEKIGVVSDEDKRQFFNNAIFHDVGKKALKYTNGKPAVSLADKERRLKPYELSIMNRHPDVGADMLAHLAAKAMAADDVTTFRLFYNASIATKYHHNPDVLDMQQGIFGASPFHYDHDGFLTDEGKKEVADHSRTIPGIGFPHVIDIIMARSDPRRSYLFKTPELRLITPTDAAAKLSACAIGWTYNNYTASEIAQSAAEKADEIPYRQQTIEHRQEMWRQTYAA